MTTKTYPLSAIQGEEEMPTRELLQMALEALKDANGLAADLNSKGCFDEEITAIRAHLEKSEPEPVAWMVQYEGKCMGFTPYPEANSVPVFTKDQL